VVCRPATIVHEREAYGFLVAAESIFFAAVSILAAAESIFMEAESIFMPPAESAGAGAIAGAAVSVFGVSFVLHAATTSTAATRARRFM
jgi:hypothetical protein